MGEGNSEGVKRGRKKMRGGMEENAEAKDDGSWKMTLLMV